MNSRPRAFAAIIKEDKILMVHEKYSDKEFWTLPGGGVETGESHEMAVVREVKEEVNLDVKVIRYLFSRDYEAGEEKCYLVEMVGEGIPILGYDPEKDTNSQTLKEIKWCSLYEMKDDLQVSLVIGALR